MKDHHLPGKAADACLTCGHPVVDHDAGECWTIAATGEQSDNPGDDQCPCSWLEA